MHCSHWDSTRKGIQQLKKELWNLQSKCIGNTWDIFPNFNLILINEDILCTSAQCLELVPTSWRMGEAIKNINLAAGQKGNYETYLTAVFPIKLKQKRKAFQIWRFWAQAKGTRQYSPPGPTHLGQQEPWAVSCCSPCAQVRAGQVLGLQVTFPWAQEHRTHPELAHCVPCCTQHNQGHCEAWEWALALFKPLLSQGWGLALIKSGFLAMWQWNCDCRYKYVHILLVGMPTQRTGSKRTKRQKLQQKDSTRKCRNSTSRNIMHDDKTQYQQITGTDTGEEDGMGVLPLLLQLLLSFYQLHAGHVSWWNRAEYICKSVWTF